MSGDVDPVSAAIRTAEGIIDHAYESSPLIGIERAPALYNVLLAAEDALFIPSLRKDLTPQQIRANNDSIINELRFPLRWVYRSNPVVGMVPYVHDRHLFDAAYDLLHLAKHYEEFAGALTLASVGAVRLALEGTTIVAQNSVRADVRYEAYNRLYGQPQSLVSQNVKGLIPEIAKRVVVNGNRFSVKIPAKIFGKLRKALAEHAANRFSLPDNWQFSRYTMGQFKRVYTILMAAAFVRSGARYVATNAGCIGLGVLDALEIRTYEEWVNLAYRFTEIDRTVIQAILEDLTYGSRGMRNPDPALQPLIPLDSNSLALPPMFFLNLDPERNLTVLLNRIPEERSIYSRIVGEKEALMRTSLVEIATSVGLRAVAGPIRAQAELPDVDIALISDAEQIALMCELKWFIEPAEAREILQKEEEISKGVTQVESVVEALKKSSYLRERLSLGDRTSVHGVVISKNWIGHAAPSNGNTAVINLDHLAHKLRSGAPLKAVVQWLRDRSYLPVEGVDFDTVITVQHVAGFDLRWYGIKPLAKGGFRPV